MRLKTNGTVLVGVGRVKALARALSTVSATRGTNCHAVVSREDNRARSAAVTSVTITIGSKRVGANTPYEASEITGCGELLQVRDTVIGASACKVWRVSPQLELKYLSFGGGVLLSYGFGYRVMFF